MKKFLALSVLVLGALLVAACNVGGGSSSDAPTNVSVVAGDGGVTISWTSEPGVEYWVFSAAASSISTSNWTTLPQARVIRNAISPQIITGLTNGTTYSFTVNGRKDGGPGGDGSPSISAVPRLSGLAWTPGVQLASNNLKGLGFIALAYPGLFVTVGADGTAFASPDAITWTTVSSGVTTELNGVAYGGGKFAAVGAGGVVVNSSDAITWTTIASGTTNDLNAIAAGNSGLVAVGANGTIIRSPDGGTTWATQTSGTTNHLYGVSFVNFQYIAVGAGGTLLTSADGAAWTVVTTPTVETLKSVAYSAINLLYVAVGTAGAMIGSTDAVTWTAIPPVTVNQLNSISVGNQFTVVGDNGTIVTSTDGVTWQVVPSGTTSHLNAVLFGLVGYSAVGQGGVNLSSF
ncbi:MAG: hypothetical protein KAX84_09240 [Burkholderiales bacterium]|nr:hypothetical protein [Burkholderiales bacterium]